MTSAAESVRRCSTAVLRLSAISARKSHHVRVPTTARPHVVVARRVMYTISAHERGARNSRFHKPRISRLRVAFSTREKQITGISLSGAARCSSARTPEASCVHRTFRGPEMRIDASETGSCLPAGISQCVFVLRAVAPQDRHSQCIESARRSTLQAMHSDPGTVSAFVKAAMYSNYTRFFEISS